MMMQFSMRGRGAHCDLLHPTLALVLLVLVLVAEVAHGDGHAFLDVIQSMSDELAMESPPCRVNDDHAITMTLDDSGRVNRDTGDNGGRPSDILFSPYVLTEQLRHVGLPPVEWTPNNVKVALRLLLVFVHIPKTGGTSFHTYLRSVTENNLVVTFRDGTTTGRTSVNDDNASGGDSLPRTLKITHGRGGIRNVNVPTGSAARRGPQSSADQMVWWFPDGSHSWNVLGCNAKQGSPKYLPRPSVGPTHCSYAEILSCLQSHDARFTSSPSVPPHKVVPHLRAPHLAFVTLLREPVARVVSEYFWWRHTCNTGVSLRSWPTQLCVDMNVGIMDAHSKVSLPPTKRAQASFAHMEKFTVDEERMRFLAWVKSPYNVAHNRQTKQLSLTASSPSLRHNNPPDVRVKKMLNVDECIGFLGELQEAYWGAYYHEGPAGQNHSGSGGSGRQWAYRSWKDGLEQCINMDTRLLTLAKERLSTQFIAIGLTEALYESGEIFKRIIQSSLMRPTFVNGGGVSSDASTEALPFEVKFRHDTDGCCGSHDHINNSKDHQKSIVTDEAKREILKRNRLDEQLYGFAKEKVKEAMVTFGVKAKSLVLMDDDVCEGDV
eukprot:TRINITY_DN8867_c0_g1_i1.p1 TRINITY_DN8867_c0_g1~~TRINITY_DN8867_c0_g1_i1.p1  ORF type:complete len:604 (-),score=94.83 TRINITY_DN8867_c0_g1_i1:76-1887(-)